jgi:hypothetical protein
MTPQSDEPRHVALNLKLGEARATVGELVKLHGFLRDYLFAIREAAIEWLNRAAKETFTVLHCGRRFGTTIDRTRELLEKLGDRHSELDLQVIEEVRQAAAFLVLASRLGCDYHLSPFMGAIHNALDALKWVVAGTEALDCGEFDTVLEALDMTMPLTFPDHPHFPRLKGDEPAGE